MRRFTFVMIKPSHYDDDGYVIQWARSAMPSNSLATLHGLAVDCRQRRVLGDDVELVLEVVDESNTRVRPERIARRVSRQGGGGLIGLVGVQTNQFPRALDLARRFRAAGLPVCIGGFHVSGCLAMLSELPAELRQALELGVALFAGEAEGRLETVLRDAFAGELRPVYDFLDELPEIGDAPTPILSARTVGRTAGRQSSFDTGRGCPFQCSFCTIINVQGRRSRSRSVESVERIVRTNLAQGVRRFLITDDNFARNRAWEPIFDRLIELREREGMELNLVLQVDALAHRVPRFIEKAGRAGVKRVFIGLESVNPASLAAADKPQNRIAEYRAMLQAWRRIGVITVAGYILGFPGETEESIRRDVELVKRELPVDIVQFHYLTPLPGSLDHRRKLGSGEPLDPDLNRYDLAHITTEHDTMSREDWKRAHDEAWRSFYSHDHMVALLRRARASGLSPGKVLGAAAWMYGSVAFERVDPLEAGFLRLRFRRDRRSGLPLEAPVVFHLRCLGRFLATTWRAARFYLRYHRVRKQLIADPEAVRYTDEALADGS